MMMMRSDDDTRNFKQFQVFIHLAIVQLASLKNHELFLAKRI
eukprot:SAG31_NODE_980_length_10594_cov_7.565889_3_plen_42_part_00